MTPLSAATASPGKGEALLGDIESLVGAVAGTAGNGSIAVICPPPQAAGLKLLARGNFDYPVFVTSALAAKQVLAVATNALVSASDPPRVDASPAADVHMSTTPSQISTPGSPPTIASPVYSIFQSDLVSLRLRWNLSWALRASGAVATITNVNW